jgi:hypothetical protein
VLSPDGPRHVTVSSTAVLTDWPHGIAAIGVVLQVGGLAEVVREVADARRRLREALPIQPVDLGMPETGAAGVEISDVIRKSHGWAVTEDVQFDMERLFEAVEAQSAGVARLDGLVRELTGGGFAWRLLGPLAIGVGILADAWPDRVAQLLHLAG